MDIKKCIPTDKHDKAAIERALSVGFPALSPIVPELLECLQDANWPVARDTVLLLSQAGIEIVPPIKEVFNAQDGIWKYWILELLLTKLKPEIQSALYDDLVRLAEHPTEQDRSEEVDIAARDVLAAWDMSD